MQYLHIKKLLYSPSENWLCAKGCLAAAHMPLVVSLVMLHAGGLCAADAMAGSSQATLMFHLFQQKVNRLFL